MPFSLIVLLITICVALFLFFLAAGPFISLLESKACIAYSPFGKRNLSFNADAAEVKIIITGDTGFGSQEQAAVAKAMEKARLEHGCDLILLAGDNFPQDGINGVYDPQLRDKFENMYPSPVPFYAVLGNHDFVGNWKAQIDYTSMSDRWNLPASDYSLETGPVSIRVINTACTIKTIWPLYKKTKKPWILAMGHHPMISAGEHGGMVPLERFLMAKSGIDFYVSGHNHALEHIEYHGVHQIISGAGGSPLHSQSEGEIPGKRFLYSGYGFVWAHITGKEAQFIYYDVNGTELYRFSKKK